MTCRRSTARGRSSVVNEMAKHRSTAAWLAACLVVSLAAPVSADGQDAGRLDPDSNIQPPTFQAQVSSNQNGVDVAISGHETVRGAGGPSDASPPSGPAAPAAAPGGQQQAPADPGPRTWSN